MIGRVMVAAAGVAAVVCWYGQAAARGAREARAQAALDGRWWIA